MGQKNYENLNEMVNNTYLTIDSYKDIVISRCKYIEDIDKDQSIKYYLDENGDYVVPKKLCKDIIKEI